VADDHAVHVLCNYQCLHAAMVQGARRRRYRGSPYRNLDRPLKYVSALGPDDTPALRMTARKVHPLPNGIRTVAEASGPTPYGGSRVSPTAGSERGVSPGAHDVWAGVL
jgi:hypothetical protein